MKKGCFLEAVGDVQQYQARQVLSSSSRVLKDGLVPGMMEWIRKQELLLLV